MDPSPDRLLVWLRGRLGGAVDFAEPPQPLSGGFDTIIQAFRLAGAPAEWSGPLILRAMTRPDLGQRVLFEVAVHRAVGTAGYPAPRVLAYETEAAPIGVPFLVMERLAGETLASAIGKLGLALPRRLAELQVRLHRIPGSLLIESARSLGIDPQSIGVRTDVERLQRRIDRGGLRGLAPGAEWLGANLPAPAQPEVIGHGDFHPLNIMVQGERVTGVIDWANAIVAEPAWDVAGLRVIALLADVGEPSWARGALNVVRRLMVRRYMSLYRAAAPLDTRNLDYYEAIRVLSALVFTCEKRPQAGNPWSAPHTVGALLRRFKEVSGLRLAR